jgi:hypothetical protein
VSQQGSDKLTEELKLTGQHSKGFYLAELLPVEVPADHAIQDDRDQLVGGERSEQEGLRWRCWLVLF